MDPRNYQIVALSAFIWLGINRLGFQINLNVASAIVCTALLAQLCLFTPRPLSGRFVRQFTGQSKSALISSLSLVLLLRTEVVFIAMLTALLAIASICIHCIFTWMVFG